MLNAFHVELPNEPSQTSQPLAQWETEGTSDESELGASSEWSFSHSHTDDRGLPY